MLTGEKYLESSQKRAVDLLGAGFIASTLGAPALAGALCIKIFEHQPVLFCNDRLGYGWQEYEMLKLTTMQSDAHHHEKQWQHDETDPRITRVGKVLRRLNLNEVPQVENIRRGDMHFVGARSVNEHVLERLQDADAPLFDEWHDQYGLHKPGLFGPGQLFERDLVRQGDLHGSSIARMRGDITYWQVDASVKSDITIAAQLPKEFIRQL